MDDRQIFQDALLDLFQSVVILVEDALRFFEVGIGSGGFVPGEFQNCLHIVADDTALRRAGSHLGKFGDLAFHLFLDLHVQLQFFKLLIPAFCFARSLFPVAEFILYHFHLLAQHIFLLILFDCLLHALADVAFHGKNLIFL